MAGEDICPHCGASGTPINDGQYGTYQYACGRTSKDFSVEDFERAHWERGQR
jgi:hypothetical protein